MKVYELDRLTPAPNYRINMSWGFLLDHLSRWEEVYSLDIEPDFQRGHVWTEKQQISYIEYCLRGGAYSRDLMFNCFRFTTGEAHDMVLVDGLQRLTAIKKFINNELKAFDYYLDDFEDKDIVLLREDVVIHVNSLPGKKAVYKWYLELNSGGTPHTPVELSFVQELYDNALIPYVLYSAKTKKYIRIISSISSIGNEQIVRVETYSDRHDVYLK